MTIDYIIVDDEPLARDGIKLNADQIPYLNHVGSFGNAIQAHGYLSNHKVDLIFLDIEMPGITGLDFIKTLSIKYQIVLTTAYSQYALESYELGVTDYLVKPIRMERFIKACTKVSENLELLSQPVSDIENYEDSFMYIKSERQYVKVYYDKVLYIKGLKDYVVIVCNDNNKYMTAMNIKTIHKQLPKELFARIGKSYIVQIKQITKIGTDTIFLGDNEVSLGPAYKEAFIQQYVLTNLVKR